MSSVVTVEIAGQRYPIRSSLDERYVSELAAMAGLPEKSCGWVTPTVATAPTMTPAIRYVALRIIRLPFPRWTRPTMEPGQ